MLQPILKTGVKKYGMPLKCFYDFCQYGPIPMVMQEQDMCHWVAGYQSMWGRRINILWIDFNEQGTLSGFGI